MKDRDKGFTLVELLVVIVIIGILAAVAIPLFLSQRAKGFDAGTKSDLKSLATSMESAYEAERNYPADLTELQDSDEDFNASDGSVIAVGLAEVDGNEAFCIRGYNEDGNRDAADDAFWYDSALGGLEDNDTTEGAAPDGGACEAATAFDDTFAPAP